MAESASDVGKDTDVIVFKPSGEITFLIEPQIERIRLMWETDGKPRIPLYCLEIVLQIYSEAEKLTEQGIEEHGLHQGWKDE